MGGALPFIGLGMQFVAQKKQERLQAQQDADNQSLANAAAADAQLRGGIESGRARMAGTQLASRQMLAYANSGVDPTVGTPASVQASTAGMSELDALTIENNAAREAWGFRRHGLQYAQLAGINAARSQNQQMGTFLSAAGAAYNAYGRWKYGQDGGGYAGFGGDAPAQPGSIQDIKAGGG